MERRRELPERGDIITTERYAMKVSDVSVLDSIDQSIEQHADELLPYSL